MAKITLDIPDDIAAALEKRHCDLATWLLDFALRQSRQDNRANLRAAVDQMVAQGKDDLIADVIKVIRKDPDVKLPRVDAVVEAAPERKV